MFVEEDLFFVGRLEGKKGKKVDVYLDKPINYVVAGVPYDEVKIIIPQDGYELTRVTGSKVLNFDGREESKRASLWEADCDPKVKRTFTVLRRTPSEVMTFLEDVERFANNYNAAPFKPQPDTSLQAEPHYVEENFNVSRKEIFPISSSMVKKLKAQTFY